MRNQLLRCLFDSAQSRAARDCVVSKTTFYDFIKIHS